jgi:hypothetical protein
MKTRLKGLWNRLERLYLSYRYPENVWYGRKGLGLKHALSCVGDGWGKYIRRLYDAKPKNVRVIQVKEKFGTLRFYTSGDPQWYQDLISYYEGRSAETCERCGADGKVRSDRYWILTLCDDCNALDREGR